MSRITIQDLECHLLVGLFRGSLGRWFAWKTPARTPMAATKPATTSRVFFLDGLIAALESTGFVMATDRGVDSVVL